MHGPDGSGVPTVRITVDLTHPVRLRDWLELKVNVLETGRSSLRLQVIGFVSEIQVFDARPTLVHVALATMTSRPWPDEVRTNLVEYQNLV
jgi:acyl-CoA thioesterase FadM